VPAPAPSTPPIRPAPAATLDLEAAATKATTGEVLAINRELRTVEIRQSPTVRTTFAYRDDSKFETAIGVTIRFDDFSDANNGRLPVALREKVEITWRMSQDGKTRLITSVKKVP
jgi:hypothetical protein